MKKLLLGLLLLPGLVIQAEEPAVQPEMPKAAEQDTAQTQYIQEIRELLRKEEVALLEGVEERALAIKPLAEEVNKLLESKLDNKNTKEVWAQVSELEKEINYGASSFWAAGIRRFSNYSADKAGYLGLKCYLNLTYALSKQFSTLSDENKAQQESYKKVLEAATKNEVEELTNCIRSNSLAYPKKDKKCFDAFFDKIRASL